ncbi:hypothetical protein TNCV_2777841 [Trichonephila clavipes]|nr:hypothetical protein TNCV_2777841 [Trichonephila clavipes]
MKKEKREVPMRSAYSQCHGSLVVMAGMLRAQAKYPPCRGTMHIKSVEFKRPPIGVVVRRGEFQLRCRPWPYFKITRTVAKSPHVAEH